MRHASVRGFTLVEIMTALAISAILSVMVVHALIGLARESSVREVVTQAQEEGRTGITVAALEVRTAALGSPTGVLWLQDATGNRAARPAVQIYEDVAGGGRLPVKPHTDVLLVVEALGSPRGAVRGDHFAPAVPANPYVITVTNAADFEAGQTIMFGEYADAGWATITVRNVANNQLTLSSTVNLYPGAGGKLPSGSLVRRAQARLYYVTASDYQPCPECLVRMHLDRPIPPATAAELARPVEVLARAFENLQLQCLVDGGGSTGLTGCGPGVSAPDPLATDATFAVGAATARVTLAQAPLLRLVRLSAVVRGARPLVQFQGDEPIDLEGGAGVSAAAAPTGTGYVRRAYQLELAVRNTSLEAL
jgi:prepilin-type N-terminal cleavage/methylation domain-containing protein